MERRSVPSTNNIEMDQAISMISHISLVIGNLASALKGEEKWFCNLRKAKDEVQELKGDCEEFGFAKLSDSLDEIEAKIVEVERAVM